MKKPFAVAAVLVVAGTVLMISLGVHLAGEGPSLRLDSMDVSGLGRSMDIHPLRPAARAVSLAERASPKW
jgi:hypothetical protein